MQACTKLLKTAKDKMVVKKDTYEYFGVNAATMRGLDRKGLKLKALKKIFQELKTFRKQKTYLYETYKDKINETTIDTLWARYVTAQLEREQKQEYLEYVKKIGENNE